MRHTLAGIGLAVGMATLTLAGQAAGQEPLRWLAHDMQRPRPAVVTPGKLALPALPPSDAMVLFDGSDLSHWRSTDGEPAKWRVRDGYMESVPGSGYLVTAESFGDVQLHVEWAAPVPARGRSQGRGNSGVFLMGLYEVQVLDSFDNDTYPDGQAAAIYGQYPPLVNACLPPGEWQSYDIVFRRPHFNEDGSVAQAARITVLHNNVLVQDNVELFGPTSWIQHKAYTSHADALPISLQDHGNPVRYRNIWLRHLPPREEPGRLAEQSPPFVDLNSEQLQAFVGAYGTLLGEWGTIRLVDDRLQMHMNTGQIIDLLPRSKSEFAMKSTAGKLEFNVDDQGAVTGFTMYMAGDKYPIRKLPAGS